MEITSKGSIKNVFNAKFERFHARMSVKHTINTMNKLKSINSENSDLEININDILGRFTLDTFVSIAFGQDIKSLIYTQKKINFPSLLMTWQK